MSNTPATGPQISDRLKRMLEEASPDELAKAIEISAKLLAMRARSKSAPSLGEGASRPGPSAERMASQPSQAPAPTLKIAPPFFDTKVSDYGPVEKLDWD